MRILVISDLPQFVTGGAEKQAANLIEAWLDAGHEVVCAGRRMGMGPVRLGVHHVPVHRIHTLTRFGRALRGLSYFCSLAFLLLRFRNRFDVVYTRFLGEAALTASFLKQCRLLDTVLVATPANVGTGNSDLNFLRSLPASDSLIRLLRTQCNAINLIAPAMINELLSAGFSASSFHTIPNGVMVRGTPPDMRGRPHQFLSVGRLTPQKGYDILIEALAKIAPPPCPGLIRIAGDGPERQALQARAAALGVDHAITWLGELEHDAVIHELNNAQVFLLPSRYEGMSNAGLEAMERGLAMLLSKCGGLDTYVSPEMGWIVEPDDPTALAFVLESAVLLDPSMRAAMGAANREAVFRQFELSIVARRYTELFEAQLSARCPGRTM